MANPFPFVAGEVLTAADMNGIGEWTSYTPVLTATTTNPVLGNGTAVGEYARVQNFIVYRFSITFGSTTTVGSGNYKISLPVTGVQYGAYYSAGTGQFSYFDVSTGNNYYANAWMDTATTLSLLYLNAFNGTLANVTAAAPVVPATGDSYSGLIIYKAA